MRGGEEGDGGSGSAGVGTERCGDVLVALTSEECEDEIACSGHDLRRGARADGRTIFVKGDVTDVVEAVLDPPMTANEGEQASGISPLGRQAGDVVGGLNAGVAGREAVLERDTVPFKAADLPQMRPGGAVSAGAAEPAQNTRVTDRPEHPQLAPSMPCFRISLEHAGDPATLVTQPAWGDRDAVAVASGSQPRGKMPPRPRRAAPVGWHRPAGHSRRPAR